MLAMSLVGFGLLSGFNTPATRAGFTFGPPVNLRSVVPILDPVHESLNSFSADGLEMYIESTRPGGSGSWDLWVLRRGSTGENWGPPENLGPVVNSSENDSLPCISSDGLTLYFNSENRPGGYGKLDVYATTRATRNSPWTTPVNLGPKVNSSSDDGVPWISADGSELYFQSWRPGGYGNSDLYVTRQSTPNGAWTDTMNLGPLVNSAYDDSDACLSPDGLVLFFSGTYFGPVRPGGKGRADMWMTRRASRSEPWQPPVNLGAPVNGPLHDFIPRISWDSSTLYFVTVDKDGTFENWQAPILPVVN